MGMSRSGEAYCSSTVITTQRHRRGPSGRLARSPHTRTDYVKGTVAHRRKPSPTSASPRGRKTSPPRSWRSLRSARDTASRSTMSSRPSCRRARVRARRLEELLETLQPGDRLLVSELSRRGERVIRPTKVEPREPNGLQVLSAPFKMLRIWRSLNVDFRMTAPDPEPSTRGCISGPRCQKPPRSGRPRVAGMAGVAARPCAR